MKRLRNQAVGALTALALFSGAPVTAGPPAGKPTPAAPAQASSPSRPKPIADSTRRGLAWLVSSQLPNGGWGQGEESVHMGGRGEGVRSVASVADSGMALLALLRAGASFREGPYASALTRGTDFVLKEIETADRDSLYVTSARGTRVQAKIGPFVDTFIAATLLAELKGKMPDPKAEARLEEALAKVMRKIETHQKADGRFEGQAWAPTLSQALAARGINRAARKGAKVSAQVRQRAEDYAAKQFDAASKSFGSDGSAGVGLYSAAATTSGLGEATGTNRQELPKLEQQAVAAPTPEERNEARAKLDRFQKTEATQKAANAAMQNRLKDPSFVSGFGSNGGEEFLSYMLVSDNLRREDPKAFLEWDQGMATNLTRVQNEDGSWTGHHCITGRTFCTAAALLVLLADRADPDRPVSIQG